MVTNVIKPTTVTKNAAPATPKTSIEKEVKAAAKATEKICGGLNKKLITHKSAALPEITKVNGVDKEEMMKIIEHLDAMGSATYSTACALRELQSRMK